jgi:glycosyltransferase involved in cell wall biosynthesis
VGIDARLFDGRHGGIQQAVIGLAFGLSRLEDGDETYCFLGYRGASQWLQDHMHGPCETILCQVPRQLRIVERLTSSPWGKALALRMGAHLKRLWQRTPISNGMIEGTGIGVMHFTFQSAFLTPIPFIYQPWDLQHVHFPENFSTYQKKNRDYRYGLFCKQSKMVAVASRWMKAELVRHYSLPALKVRVVPAGPPVDAYPLIQRKDLERVRRSYDLPEAFILFPSQTYPHKNHLGLCEALAMLRDQHGIVVPVICTGMQTDFFARIASRLKQLGQSTQVRFLGYIPPLDLKCLYKLCRFMIFPSRYEGWGLPISEGLRLGVPVACSHLPVLKEQAADAALFFDPSHPYAVADAVKSLWIDDQLCLKLSRRAMQVANRFNWEHTAKIFRAFYRQLSMRPLSPEDRDLIEGSE